MTIGPTTNLRPWTGRLARAAVLGAVLTVVLVNGAADLVSAAVLTESGATGASSQPQAPIAAGVIYPWYPSHWTEGGTHPYTNYTPSLGWYSSLDDLTIREQLRLAERSHLEAFLSSWWEPGEITDIGLEALLRATEQTGSPMRTAVYYEREGYSDPSIEQIARDLEYLVASAFQSPAYLRVNDKPVVFAYGAGIEGCSMVERWRSAEVLARVDAYVSLKVFPGYTDCVNQPDSWHQYSPSAVYDAQLPYSITVSPGFWKVSEAPLLARNTAYFEAAVQWMAVLAPDWQIVTTWNEWAEGTSVEPAEEYGTTYLEILCQSLPGAGTCTDIMPSQSPPATSSPPVSATASPSPTSTGTPAATVTATPPPTPAPSSVPTATMPTQTPSSATPTATPGTSPPLGPTQTPISSPTASPKPRQNPTRTPRPTIQRGTRGDLDCNQTIDAQDALAIVRILASLSNIQPGGCLAASGLDVVADVDCDGSVTALDALLVLQISVSANSARWGCGGGS